VKIFNWIGTMWGGSIRFSTPMLFAVGFIGMFIIGGISGITHSSAPADAQQQDTYYIVAHLHYVLFGGSIMGLFAGIYYWFPKVTGRMMHDGMGKAHFWILAIGANLTFFPMHILGLNGMPRRIYTYSEQQGWESLNLLSTAGAFLIAASMLIFVYNVVRSLRVGERAGNDPWDGRTLEWSITSPPPEYNFAVIPTVHSRDPFWDQKYEEGQVSAEERPELSNGPISQPEAPNGPVGTGYGGGGEERHLDIHMPSPSYFPIITAFGLGLAGALFIVEPWFATIGAGIMGIGLYGWAAEPVSPEEH
jgi:cytochrome c oxidase subunit 1